jgi:translation initiation factor 5A
MSFDSHFLDTCPESSRSHRVSSKELRKGGHIVIANHPCRIVNLTSVKNGKHGHAKITLVGIDIFSGKKYEDSFPASHTVYTPIVEKKEYDVVDISDGFFSLLGDDAKIKADVRVPDGNVGTDIQRLHQEDKAVCVTVLHSMDMEKVVSFKCVSV